VKTRVPRHDAPEVKVREDERVRQVRRYKLITPLFGGGVEPNRADPITVVRGTGVRGQLRFWWRAARGGQFDGSLEKMRRREEEIWGSAAAKGKPGPSDVVISVEILNRGRPFQVVDNKGRPVRNIGDVKSPYSYVAFPLRDAESNPPVLEDVEFELTICCPSKWEQDIEATLWAWETFGGLGARTRRGFGALQLLSIDNKPSPTLQPNQVEMELHKNLQRHVTSGIWPKHVPHLNCDLRMRIVSPSGSQSSSAIEVWNDLIQSLQDFRQKRHKRMGSSLWPEANEIRHRLNRATKWPPRFKSPRLVHKFPRAVFGLPIIFHLPHDKNLPAKSFTIQGKPDPDPTSEKTFERLASVLILKPIPCNNDDAVGIAAVLDAPVSPPYGLEIKEPVQDKQSVEWQLDKDEANSVPIREILHGQTDVIEVFLNSLDTIARKIGE